MLITLFTVSYPHFEVSDGDAQTLLAALAKHFPHIPFSRENEGAKVLVKADISNQPDRLLSERLLRAWAQGFMASASLWER